MYDGDPKIFTKRLSDVPTRQIFRGGISLREGNPSCLGGIRMSEDFARHRLRERGGMPESQIEHEIVRAGQRGFSCLPEEDTPEILRRAQRGFSCLPDEYHDPSFR